LTVGIAKGINAMGHLGWVTVRCRICATWLDITGGVGRVKKSIVYACPRCAQEYEAYFCRACAKKVRYTCPYCRSPLTLVTPLVEA
jgi:hypothetical protein